MCKAFSCIVTKKAKVTWKFGVDSHEELIKLAGLKDTTANKELMQFARIEISPKNGNYLKPDKFVYRVDESIRPDWLTYAHEKACMKEFRVWKAQLYKILIKKPIVHPFKLKPPKITAKHISLLKEWDSVGDSVRASVWDSVGDSVRASVWDSVGDSVRASVRDSVWASVGDSVGDSVRASVRDSVWASVGDSVRDSVWDSVWAYIGSFFALDRNQWKYITKIKTKSYPFESAVKLWEMGLVTSFDGTTWRLHGGKKAKILFEITKKELMKYGT